MSEYATAEKPHAETKGERVNVPLTIVAAVLGGLGIFGTFYWLMTFNWLYFPSVFAIALSCYLLFTRITGPDHG